MSKVNFRRPTTPDMTGPVWIPTRNSSAANRIFSRCAFMRAVTA